MKTKVLIAFLLVATTSLFAQKSPRQEANGTVNSIVVTVDYSSPRVKGRTIYGDLVPYDNVWRAGADKNTTVSFSKNAKVNGRDLKAGKYGFFIIPKENGAFTVIFNKKNDAWGSYSYNESQDALRLDVKTKNTSSNVENLTFDVTDKGIVFAWADKTFTLDVQ